MPAAYDMIRTLLERNNLSVSDITKCCFSQFALSNILKIQQELGFKDEQISYVGDRFGYTGTSSPFIALHETIESEDIHRGDHVLFWTVGAGFKLVAMLFKY